MDILKIYDNTTSTWKTIPAIKGDTGVSVTSATINGEGHLILTLSSGATIDTGVAKGSKGDNGDDGRGITSISKTSTVGLVDTYTITYTDSTTSTYSVTNGAKGDTGAGVPSGGTPNQLLRKKSATNYDTEWYTPEASTTDYNDLINKPKVNNVELSGNKSLSDLSLYSKSEVDTAIANKTIMESADSYVEVSESNNKVIIHSNDDATLFDGSQGIDLDSGKIINLANPTANQDGANKYYVDNHHDNTKADASALTSHTSSVTIHHTISTTPDMYVEKIDNKDIGAKYDGEGNEIFTFYGTVNDINAINEKIPSQASSSNQLADKSFVNSSISTNTAYFRGTSASGLTEAQFLAWANGLTKTNNDYVFWNTTDSDGNVVYKRYKYNGSAWVFEFALNNSSFTASQWASVNSGITDTKVSTYDGYATTIANKVDKVSGKGLSTNDYDNTEKGNVASNTSARHTHSNKTVLDGISSTNISTWNGKQDAISDLATIRSNASSGASKVSCTDATVGGFGYTKNSGTVTSVAVKMNGATKGTVTTSGTIDLGTILTAHQDISGKEDKGKVTISSTQYNVGSVDLVVTFDDSTTATYHLLVRS